jgi:hypothetical protein
VPQHVVAQPPPYQASQVRARLVCLPSAPPKHPCLPRLAPHDRRRLTEKADVFSFGVVLYELLSRSPLLAWRLPAASAPAGAASGRWAAAPGAASAGAAPGVAGVRNVSITTPDGVAMLSYALRAADGYRPPVPPGWPQEAAALVAACCAQEPHERPRMAEVLQALAALAEDERVLAALDAYTPKGDGAAPGWLLDDGGGGGGGGAEAVVAAGGGPAAGANGAAPGKGGGGTGGGSGGGSGRGSAHGSWSSRVSSAPDGGAPTGRSGSGSSARSPGGGASSGALAAPEPQHARPPHEQQPCGCVVC